MFECALAASVHGGGNAGAGAKYGRGICSKLRAGSWGIPSPKIVAIFGQRYRSNLGAPRPSIPAVSYGEASDGGGSVRG